METEDETYGESPVVRSMREVNNFMTQAQGAEAMYQSLGRVMGRAGQAFADALVQMQYATRPQPLKLDEFAFAPTIMALLELKKEIVIEEKEPIRFIRMDKKGE